MSNNLFEGKLRDSSGNHVAVQILLYSYRLVVHQVDASGKAHTQSWEMDKIKNCQQVSKEAVSIQYGDPVQTLEVVSEEFVRKFNPPTSGIGKRIHRFRHSGGIIVLSILGVLVGLSLVAYFFLFPWLVDLAASNVPQRYEVQIGEQMYQAFVQSEEVDTVRTKVANDFLKQIDFKTDYPLQVTVVKSEIKNAFAMPGGHVVVYSHLLGDMKGYKELAALLGHEVGHVKRRHSTKHVFQSLSTYLVVSILLGDMSGISAIVVENAGKLNQLSYSRSLEKEADEEGFQTLVVNKIDPNGMVDLFHNLQKGNEMEGKVPEFLSTHPITENRLEFIQEKIKSEKPFSRENKTLAQLFDKLRPIE